MSDEPSSFEFVTNDRERADRIIAQAEAKARIIRETAMVCEACGRTMLRWGAGRTIHFSCEPGTLAGKRCTCPPECSGTHWGNGPRECAPGCEVCKIKRGQPLHRGRGKA